MENMVVTGSEGAVRNALLFLERATLRGSELAAFTEVVNMFRAVKPVSRFVEEVLASEPRKGEAT